MCQTLFSSFCPQWKVIPSSIFYPITLSLSTAEALHGPGKRWIEDLKWKQLVINKMKADKGLYHNGCLRMEVERGAEYTQSHVLIRCKYASATNQNGNVIGTLERRRYQPCAL
ncbi:hypothetical protein KFK09_011968 [Dendrobium nobile]|uniref:Uncharacterized protein n=1 Tax=Dendrobium nobile TaxID=94219 RepID=A0A8T3BDZ9_DENNO|nr:hypothetical protein KFK09_011968 [Dendrobium nobile]